MLNKTKKIYDSRIYNFNHKDYHKVNCIRKELWYRNNRGDSETAMYPEVYTLTSATLRWSGVEAQSLPQHHEGLTVFFSSLPTKREVLDPLWNLEGGHRTGTKLGENSTT
jgi:hypothetical protein